MYINWHKRFLRYFPEYRFHVSFKTFTSIMYNKIGQFQMKVMIESRH